MRLGRTEVRQCVVVMVILPISRPVFVFQIIGSFTGAMSCREGKGRTYYCGAGGALVKGQTCRKDVVKSGQKSSDLQLN